MALARGPCAAGRQVVCVRSGCFCCAQAESAAARGLAVILTSGLRAGAAAQSALQQKRSCPRAPGAASHAVWVAARLGTLTLRSVPVSHGTVKWRSGRARGRGPSWGKETERDGAGLGPCSLAAPIFQPQGIGSPSVYHAVIVIFLEFFAWGLLTAPTLVVSKLSSDHFL